MLLVKWMRNLGEFVVRNFITLRIIIFEHIAQSLKHFIENMHEKNLAIVFSENKDEILIFKCLNF